jgi:hypothetical protein
MKLQYWIISPLYVAATSIKQLHSLDRKSTASNMVARLIFAARGVEIHVKSGQSIQRAIEHAQPGDVIVIQSGTYKEQLKISTNDLSLVSNGAVIKPPATFKPNTCSGLAGPGTQAGICVTGSGVKLAQFVVEHRKVLSVAEYVTDVTIRGVEVDGFDLNIVAIGAQNARLLSNTLRNAASYGLLSDGSIGTISQGNTITFSPSIGFIGMCNDNRAGAEVWNNYVSGYTYALCLQTDHARVYGNVVSNNCFGAFVDPRVNGVDLYDNYFGPTNTACGNGSAGIIISGAIHTSVRHNTITGQIANGYGAGIAIVDDPCTEAALSCVTDSSPAFASDNIVTGNIFRKNDLDIYLNTTGTHNVIMDNQCSTSVPPSICS